MKLFCLAALLAASPLAAQSDTALFQSPNAHAALGDWRADRPKRAFCLVHWHDYGSLFVIDSISPADTNAPVWCPAPSGLYPLLIDAPECPPRALRPEPFPFVMVRCGASDWYRFTARPVSGSRT